MAPILETPDNFETVEETEARQRELIKQLRKSKQVGADDLADLLENCLEGDIPCNSGACLKCGRHLRLQFLKEISPWVNSAVEVHKMTVVLRKYLVPRGMLHTLDLVEIKQFYQRFLRDHTSPNLVFIGGIDISLNSFENDDYHWAPHICVLVLKLGPGPSIDEEKKTIRKAIDRVRSHQTTYSVETPLWIPEVRKGTESRAATYCLKTLFWWRSGYWKTQNLRGRAQDRAYPEKSLKDRDAVELRLWLSQLVLPNRMILVGASNHGPPDVIQLRPNSRTPKLSKDSKGKPKPKRVKRSNKVSRGKGRRRIKGARPRGKVGR